MSQEPMNNFTPRAQQVLALARKLIDANLPARPGRAECRDGFAVQAQAHQLFRWRLLLSSGAPDALGERGKGLGERLALSKLLFGQLRIVRNLVPIFLGKAVTRLKLTHFCGHDRAPSCWRDASR